MTNDVVIRGGIIIDGTGAAGTRADVGLSGSVIREIGTNLTGDSVIDADGLVVAPGFIDVHTHYDAQVLWDPWLTPSAQYGVTTLVMGNCGIGVAPTAPGDDRYLAQLLASVEGMPEEVLLSALPWSWRSYG